MVGAVRHAGGRHCIGDQRDPARTDPGAHVPVHRRVQVNPVTEHLHRHPRVLDQRGHRSGLAVVHRTHRIEQVRPDPRPGLDRRDGLVVGGIGVPDGGDRPGIHDLGDGVQCAVQFGGDGDHPDRPTGGLENPRDFRGIRRSQGVRIMRPALVRGQPRALQVDAGQGAVGDQRGQGLDLSQQVTGVGGDQRSDHRGGAVAGVGRDARGHGVRVGVAVGEGAATTAVDVGVDESGDDRGVPQIVNHGAVRAVGTATT